MLAGADEGARVKLGAHTDTPPEILCRLASDPLVTVRAAVAMNPETPEQAHVALVADQDARVRALLGRKLAALAGNPSDAALGRLEQQALALLSELVADTAVQVRTAIADEMKQLPHAPRDLILRLAHDTTITVSESACDQCDADTPLPASTRPDLGSIGG
jgi:hypothetical protein